MTSIAIVGSGVSGLHLGLLEHYPMCFERVDRDGFGLQGPTDLLQGALTPVVREDYIRLGTGKFALAMGDAHCVVDPVNGRALTRRRTLGLGDRTGDPG